MNNWKLVGKILKTKGFDGTTIIGFDYPILDSSFKAFFIKKNNLYTPLLIDRIDEIDEYTCHIKWVNYPSKEHALSLHNREIYIAENLIEKHFDIEALEDFTGYELFNDEEKIGVVIALYENNFQETIEVEMSNSKKLLIPLIDEFIETIDDEKKTIYCHLSSEFIDMFSN